MINKVKPFYIKITDDMTPQMVQDAFDKCVDAGAVACEGIDNAVRKHAYHDCYDINFNNFGVNKHNETLLHDGSHQFGGPGKEITLDQLDEWLGLEVEKEWRNGDDAVHNSGGTFKFIGNCDTPSGHDCVLMCSRGEPVLSFIHEIRKPETPEQKAERERLEAAYDLYLLDCEYFNLERKTIEDVDLDYYLRFVDKTGYRKQ